MRIYLLITLVAGSLFLLSDVKAASVSDTPEQLLDKIERELYTSPEQVAYWAMQAKVKSEDSSLKAKYMYYYAMAEKLLGNFDGSIQALYEADGVVRPEERLLKGKIYNLMSFNYGNLSDHTKAIELNDKAISLFKIEQDSLNLAIAYSNRGVIHSYIYEFQQADHFLRQALALNRSQKNLRNIAANLNNLCLYKGNLEEQFAWINEAIVINKHLNSVWSLAENYNNLGKLHYYARNYKEAIRALTEAQRMVLKLNAKGILCDNYEYFAMVYSAMGNFKRALEMQSKLYNLSKEVQSSNKLRAVEEQIAQKRLQERQQEAERSRQKYEIELLKRNIYLISLVAVFVLVVMLLLIQRFHRIRKIERMKTQIQLEQSEHEIAKLKVQQQELELASVQNALESTKQEATNIAVFLQSRNELLEKIQEQIRRGYKMDKVELTPHLKKINAFISQYQIGDKTNSATMQVVDEKNQEFITRLLEKHPNLTQGEKHLASLLRVSLSTKEIAMLMGSTPKTVNMGRYRLRKSLGLSPEDDLSEYLKSI